ncbi:hypothetical protein [Vibrio europaeus]|uniref:hypothetical protein n=1 Tax=Vibrio europaeus TaxID=300876 RepID=UPI0039DFDD76
MPNEKFKIPIIKLGNPFLPSPEANQYGPGDVFVLNMQTYTSQCLTFHGSKETPYSFSADGSQVLFQSQRIGNGDSEVNNGYFGRANRLYAIPASGGREQVLLANSVSSYSVSHDGRQALYTDLPSYTEQPWRKGSLSDAARNIWKYDVDTQTHTQVTTFRGEDRNAVWADDDQSMYFLSERSGSFNVWKQSLNGHEDDAVAVTHHTKLPVRFLSISQRGDLAYGFDGGIWLKKNNEATPYHIKSTSVFPLRGAKPAPRTSTWVMKSLKWRPRQPHLRSRLSQEARSL